MESDNVEELTKEVSRLRSLEKENRELREKLDVCYNTIALLSSEVVGSRKRPWPSTSASSEVASTSGGGGPPKPKSLKTTEHILRFLQETAAKKNGWKPALSAGASANAGQTEIDQTTDEQTIPDLPVEVIAYLFRYVTRDDLDRCKRVCKQWRALIDEKSKNLPYRVITTLKIIEKGFLTLSASTKTVAKKYSFQIQGQDRTDLFEKMKELLRYATVKRWIICELSSSTSQDIIVLGNLAITENFASGLRACLSNLPVEFTRVEMLAVNLLHMSPDVFHRMMGRTIVAQQFFIDGVRNAVEDHFSAQFLDQQSIRNADDFTVYDVRAADGEEVLLDVGDDALADFIFGGEKTPQRNSLYLDSPNISSAFLAQFLVRFVDAEDIDHMVVHCEFAHCHEQTVPIHRNVVLEYEHEIQIEWSAKNKKTGRIMEARVSRNGDGDNFCHVTLNLGS
ncbi:hypothetical protein AAVH_08693 [Aphelenchoides avenae]|nr:hypothetical protein AAVH_08693 [Aphelenchus avenae]